MADPRENPPLPPIVETVRDGDESDDEDEMPGLLAPHPHDEGDVSDDDDDSIGIQLDPITEEVIFVDQDTTTAPTAAGTLLPAPIMGGTAPDGDYWCGGVPNKTWTGLEDPSAGWQSPHQFRSASPQKGQKSYYYQVKGLETKLKGADGLARSR